MSHYAPRYAKNSFGGLLLRIKCLAWQLLLGKMINMIDCSEVHIWIRSCFFWFINATFVLFIKLIKLVVALRKCHYYSRETKENTLPSSKESLCPSLNYTFMCVYKVWLLYMHHTVCSCWFSRKGHNAKYLVVLSI